MSSKIKNSEISDNFWISITGYRTLLTLRYLIEKGRTIEELIDLIKGNQFVQKSTSKDTVRLTINTLKAAGCVISRPSKKNFFKYELISHPFVLSLSPKELDCLIFVRDKFAQDMTLREIKVLNKLYSKIASLTENESIIEYIEDTKPLNAINKKLLSELSNPKILNKKIQIKYNSPKYGEEDIEIVPIKLLYENEKVHLWCYNCKYESFGILNLERIININAVHLSEEVILPTVYDVVYELTCNALYDFEPKEYEEVVKTEKDKLVINAKVEDEFMFIQRLLLFGRNFKVISPDFFKERLINKIKLIQKGYINDKI